MTHPRDGSVIAGLAEGQHGVVERGQLVELTRSAITRLSQAGWLHRVHPVVYAVGHRRLTVEGTYMAAVLACGPAGVLSHRAAAALWGLRPSSARIEVTVGTTARRVSGLRIRRSRTLQADGITHRDQIPVTSVARTLLDLAGVVPPDHLHKALDRAERLRLFEPGGARGGAGPRAGQARSRGASPGARRVAARPFEERARVAIRPSSADAGCHRPRPTRWSTAKPPPMKSTPSGPNTGWPCSSTAGSSITLAETASTTPRATPTSSSPAWVMRLTWDDVTTREGRTLRRLEPLVFNDRR